MDDRLTRWAAKHLRHAWYIGKRFCRSSWRIGADQRSDWYGLGSGELLAAAQNNREDDFKGLHSMNFREEDSSKIKILLWNLLARIQELQNEIHCMNDSRDSQDSESVRSGRSHVTSQPVSFPLHPIPG